jgi:hypothetical protein
MSGCFESGRKLPLWNDHSQPAGPHMQPFDLALAPNGIAQTIQAVADDAVDALDTRCDEDLGKRISNRSRHLCALQHVASRQRSGSRPARQGKIRMKR